MRRLGVLLVIAAVGGFLTVADDLQHKGELLAVSSILVCGLVLVALPGRKGAGAGLLCLAALGAVLAAEMTKGTGLILSAPPAQPDAGATYLFYLHGRIVQEQGRKAVSAPYGPYEYDAILEGLAKAGLVVISEIRPRGMEPAACADRVAGQIKGLLDAGVPARRITG